MMKPEIKQKWVQALRSGEYKQCYSCLKFNNCFCVLGVLCDILKQEVNGRWDNHGKFITPNGARTTVLTGDVVKYCNLDSNNPELNTDGMTHKITVLNDRYHYTFDELAYLIETNL